MGVEIAAIVLSSVIGASESKRQSDKQQKIADDDRKEREQVRLAEQNRLDEIARNTKPEEITAGQAGVKFGSGDEPSSTGTNQFLIPKDTALGASGRTGLGFAL